MVFHVIHPHVPGPFCPQELLSFREQHAKESEQTVVRLVRQQKEKREREDVNQQSEGLDSAVTWEVGDGADVVRQMR